MPGKVEDVFSDLFAVLQECAEEGGTPAEQLARVEEGIARIKRGQKLRPVVEYLNGALKELVHLPRDLAVEIGTVVATQPFR